MAHRASFIEFVSQRLRRKRARPERELGETHTYKGQAMRFYLPREDVETLYFAGGGALFFGLLTAYRGGTPGEAVMVGTMAASGLVAGVYGIALLNRATPQAAATVLEVRQMVKTRGLVRSSTGEAVGARLTGEPPPDVSLSWEGQYRIQLRRFLTAGRLAGSFSNVKLTRPERDDHGGTLRAAYMTDGAWRKLKRLAEHNGILETTSAGTQYASGMTYGKACQLVAHAPLKLPPAPKPEGRPAFVPVVTL
jgi:hypothetical protein